MRDLLFETGRPERTIVQGGAFSGTHLIVHPRHHLILSTAAAVALYPHLGRRVAIPWSASLLADLDHVPPFVWQHGLVSPATMWRHFRSDRDEERPRLLHDWTVILIGLALAPLWPLLSLAAMGLAFHRLLDDLHGLLQTPWRRWQWRVSAKGRQHARLHRRDGYACQVCGATGQPLELHSIAPPGEADRDEPHNLISVCVPCHRQLHEQPVSHPAGS